MATGTRLGIEVDGPRATLVVVEDGTVADIRTKVAATTEQALDAVLEAAPASAPVRAALVTDGLTARRVDVTAASLTYDAFADLAYAATGSPREGTTAAGLLFDVDGVRTGLLGAGLAAVAPAEPVTALYDQLRSRNAEVVPAGFTVGELEGLALALRHTGAELTLAVDGHVVAHQVLRTGGLAGVEAVLGGGTSTGPERLTAALASNGATDPMASAALERYLRSVLTEVRDTVEVWARRGEQVTRDIYVHGPGARARTLDVLTRDVELTRREHSHISKALVHLPPAERSVAVTAYLAASTVGHGTPYAAFPAPGRVAQLERAARRSRVRRRLVTFTTAGAVLAAGAAGPVTLGALTHQAAQSRLAQAQRHLAGADVVAAKAATVGVLERAHQQLQAPHGWESALAHVDRAAGSQVSVSATRARANADRLLVTVTGTARTVDDVATFASALSHAPDVSEAVARDVADTGGRASFTVEFTIDGRAR